MGGGHRTIKIYYPPGSFYYVGQMPDGTSDVAERTDCSQRGADPAELPTYAGLSMLGI